MDIYAVSIDRDHERLLLSNGELVDIYDYLDEDQEQTDEAHADAVIYLDGVGNMRAACLDDLDLLVWH